MIKLAQDILTKEKCQENNRKFLEVLMKKENGDGIIKGVNLILQCVWVH